MNEYRIRATGEVITEQQFRDMHPNVSFPAVIGQGTLNDFGVDPVLAAPPPQAGAFQSVDRSGATQDSLGNWVQAWTVTDWPAEQVDAAKAQARLDKWEEIKAERERRVLLGGFPVGGHWFHSDLVARSQYLTSARKADLVAAAAGDMNAVFKDSGGNDIYIKVMDNGYVPATASLAHQIIDAAELQENSTYKAAVMHKTAMEASANPAAYDFSGGWPPIYGE